MKAILGALVAILMAAPAYADGSVARAQFTDAVVDREPTNQILTLTNDQEQIYFYTDLRDMAGQRVVHRWEYTTGPTSGQVYFDGVRWIATVRNEAVVVGTTREKAAAIAVFATESTH